MKIYKFIGLMIFLQTFPLWSMQLNKGLQSSSTIDFGDPNAPKEDPYTFPPVNIKNKVFAITYAAKCLEKQVEEEGSAGLSARDRKLLEKAKNSINIILKVSRPPLNKRLSSWISSMQSPPLSLEQQEERAIAYYRSHLFECDEELKRDNLSGEL